MDDQLMLAGDIGGTKSYLALFSLKNGLDSPLVEDLFRSNAFTSFAEMAQTFLQKHSFRPSIASIGVAGPVFAGSVKMTKLSWQISESELKTALGVRQAFLLNDLAAIGHAIPILKDDDLEIIHQGVPEAGGVTIVVAPGTGLGETFITRHGDQPVVHATEGGHSLFAARTSLQMDLLRYAHKHYGQVTNDLLCSGRGIAIIYDFLRARSADPEPEWLTEKLQQALDRTPIIVEAGQGVPSYDQIAKDTIVMFVEMLASECANFTLKTLASGGVYIAGGILPRIREFFEEKTFMAIFGDCDPLRDYLENIPVTMIVNPRAALLGATNFALNLMKQQEGSIGN